jgi:hypothetical protein
MSILRFSGDEYRVLCRLSERIPLEEMTPSALQHFLVAHLPPQQTGLARRIARLDNLQMQLLQENLPGLNPVEAMRDVRDAFTEAELEAVADAWDPFPYPIRFLRHLRYPLVRRVSDSFPGLARKLSGLSERQFTLLFEHVKGRREGNA